MTILFMILWCAVMKELLEEHQDRHLYEEMIVQVNTIITVFAFTLMFFVPFVPIYFLWQVVKKAGQLVTGPDAVLNEIYMTAHMKKVNRRKDTLNHPTGHNDTPTRNNGNPLNTTCCATAVFACRKRRWQP